MAVTDEERVWLDPQVWKSPCDIDREPPMGRHAPAIEQTGRRQGVDTGADRDNAPGFSRSVFDPACDRAIGIGAPQAGASRDDDRVEPRRGAQSRLRLKNNPRLGDEM